MTSMHQRLALTNNGKTLRALGRDETRKRLMLLFARPFDPSALEGMQLDSREVGKFIAELLRVMRIAVISSRLKGLSWFIENAFYEAYSAAQDKRLHNVDLNSVKLDLQ